MIDFVIVALSSQLGLPGLSVPRPAVPASARGPETATRPTSVARESPKTPQDSTTHVALSSLQEKRATRSCAQAGQGGRHGRIAQPRAAVEANSETGLVSNPIS